MYHEDRRAFPWCRSQPRRNSSPVIRKSVFFLKQNCPACVIHTTLQNGKSIIFWLNTLSCIHIWKTKCVISNYSNRNVRFKNSQRTNLVKWNIFFNFDRSSNAPLDVVVQLLERLRNKPETTGNVGPKDTFRPKKYFTENSSTLLNTTYLKAQRDRKFRKYWTWVVLRYNELL